MQGEGDLPPLERSDSGSGKGGAKRRAAQAKRGSLGKPLAGARGKHPLAAFAFVVAVAFQPIREGRCGEGTDPLRWVAKDCNAGRRQGGNLLPPKTAFRKPEVSYAGSSTETNCERETGRKAKLRLSGRAIRRKGLLLKCTLLYDGDMEPLIEKQVHFEGDRSGTERI